MISDVAIDIYTFIFCMCCWLKYPQHHSIDVCVALHHRARAKRAHQMSRERERYNRASHVEISRRARSSSLVSKNDDARGSVRKT